MDLPTTEAHDALAGAAAEKGVVEQVVHVLGVYVEIPEGGVVACGIAPVELVVRGDYHP